MHDMIFVNLPVADIARSRTFFTDLGYSFNEDFCDGKALALVLGESQCAMLLETSWFATFHDAGTADATKQKECLVALSARSKDEVDTLVDKAVSLGATEGRTQDLGFMYGRSYDDLDGHTWEIIWMDQAGPQQG